MNSKYLKEWSVVAAHIVRVAVAGISECPVWSRARKWIFSRGGTSGRARGRY